jgi:adenine-specific DNA-methyltransferase
LSSTVNTAILKDKKNYDTGSLLCCADRFRKIANSYLCEEKKGCLGQYMTPASVCEFMASLFPESKEKELLLLDPGSGVGSLTSAFLSVIEKWKKVKTVKSFNYEIDSTMIKYLKQNMLLSSERMIEKSIEFRYEILEKDFIEEASKDISESDGLWKRQIRKYTHCIMNPPYKKILSSSRHRKLLKFAGIETVNLYSGFVSLAVSLLEENGILVAIIPRSFCNGPYYKPFREFIIKNAAIKHIHLFESRNKAFKDDGVLQENIIVMLEKNGFQDNVTVSTSTDDSFFDLSNISVPINKIIKPDDKDFFFHIPSEKVESNKVLFKNSLSDIGLRVSTGPVVDFRVKKYLCQNIENNSVPLLYPCHFSLMKTVWPNENGKKPNAITVDCETQKWLYPRGYYTVVRRFSSKEEKRRIVASVVCPEYFEGFDFIGFENHLNVYHINKSGLPKNVAQGMAVFLNSSTIDRNFREFSGHTQVNATDLRSLKYPSLDILIKLGVWSDDKDNITTEMIDRQLETFENE